MAASSKDTGDKSLLEFLDLQQLNCLNESSNHTLQSIVSSKTRNTVQDSYLLSDADEQLILNIAFNQSVRVRSIRLTTSSSSVAQAPKEIKLVANKPSIGFEDMQDASEPEVAQVLELSEEDVSGEGKIKALRFVRFQSVSSLHIFVKSNQGDEEETRIDSIDVFGVPVETTKDLSGLQQKEE